MSIRARLSRNEFVLVVYAVAASFSTYFCMYAFRKPFAAATYEGQLGELELKTVYVIAQVLGYTASKYIGIRWVSSITDAKRGRALLALIGAAQLALLAFAFLPASVRPVALFFNGLPLGMVWGLVVRYLEGRRTSELLLAGLSCSFIVASGVVKDIGRALMGYGVSEAWMPFVVGLIFVIPFAGAVWLLEQLPPPSEADVEARVERRAMTTDERRAFFRRYAGGLLSLFAVYFLLTAYRDFRDNYGIEIFATLGYAEEPAIFTQTELPVAFGVLLALGLLYRIQDNRRALGVTYAIMIIGACTLGIGTWLHDTNQISGATWMVLTGIGSYLIYVPYGSILFDRLVAVTGVAGTAVFAIYVADALGYTGSVGVQLYKDFAQSDVSRAAFFRTFTLAQAAIGIVLLAASGTYFMRTTMRTQG